MSNEKKPELIEDAQLDEASGGLLLPAVQKVREAHRATDSTAPYGGYLGGVMVAAGDVNG